MIALAGLWPAPASANPSVIAILSAGVGMIGWAVLGDRAAGDERATLGFAAGGFDVVPNQNRDTANLATIEYTGSPLLWKLHPVAGAGATTDGALMAYGGIRLETWLTDHAFLHAGVAPSFYMRNGGKDLGAPLLLRTGVGAGVRFDDGSRLEVSFYHMSHAELFEDRNSAVETLRLGYTLPIADIW